MSDLNLQITWYLVGSVLTTLRTIWVINNKEELLVEDLPNEYRILCIVFIALIWPLGLAYSFCFHLNKWLTGEKGGKDS